MFVNGLMLELAALETSVQQAQVSLMRSPKHNILLLIFVISYWWDLGTEFFSQFISTKYRSTKVLLAAVFSWFAFRFTSQMNILTLALPVSLSFFVCIYTQSETFFILVCQRYILFSILFFNSRVSQDWKMLKQAWLSIAREGLLKPSEI